MAYKLPLEILNEESVRNIIKCINYGELQYKEHVKEEGFITHNGKYHEIWNYIFKNVNNSFKDYPYKCYKINRGNLWEFVAVYNEEEHILYVIMKEDRFKNIENADEEYHYIRILNYLNNHMQTKKIDQISFLQDDKDKEDYIKDDLQRMLGDISGEVKACVDILFSERDNKVTKIYGNICDYNFRLIKSYCWNQYIQADINEIIDTDEEYIVENPPIELIIRDNIKSKSNQEKENIQEDMLADENKQKKKVQK